MLLPPPKNSSFHARVLTELLVVLLNDMKSGSRAAPVRPNTVCSNLWATRGDHQQGPESNIRSFSGSPPTSSSTTTDSTSNKATMASSSISGSSTTSIPTVGQLEALYFYRGLPSKPLLIARSMLDTRPWPFDGPGQLALIPYKRLVPMPIPHHAGEVLLRLWKDTILPGLVRLLSVDLGVKCTSVDPVGMVARDAETGYLGVPEPVVWVGVLPGSLDRQRGAEVVARCAAFLEEHEILDVEVQIRESVVTPLAGPSPPLLDTDDSEITAVLRHPFTYALGVPLSSRFVTVEVPPTKEIETPTTTIKKAVNGTGAFYIRERPEGRLLLVSARHVFVDRQEPNVLIDVDSKAQAGSAIDVRAPSCDLFAETRDAIVEERQYWQNEADSKPVTSLEGMVARQYHSELVALEGLLVEREAASARVLGRVVWSPPLRFGAPADEVPTTSTRDVAVVHVEEAKVPSDLVNVLDLCGIRKDKIVKEITKYAAGPFSFPDNRLLHLWGAADLWTTAREPFLVFKNGTTTGLSIGRAAQLEAYICVYDQDQTKPLYSALEMPIMGHLGSSQGGNVFSAHGDSGAAVVDCHGRILGMLTNGSGSGSGGGTSRVVSTDFLDAMEAAGHGEFRMRDVQWPFPPDLVKSLRLNGNGSVSGSFVFKTRVATGLSVGRAA
uniref:Uncharacterized protein n=1 Tax=Mycena chlorophos TaxID=658473 RepID=A0ABQ0M9X7_MYCCL|nr:predicted protein [Mycena chlorophos]